VDITNWINANREQAAELVNAQLQKELGKGLKKEVLADAFSRLTFSTDPFPRSIELFAAWAYDLGFATEKPDINGLVDLRLLEKARGTVFQAVEKHGDKAP
jgi:NitT/TauT family transport system substrate-binding protein